jgi:hypothetical protein
VLTGEDGIHKGPVCVSFHHGTGYHDAGQYSITFKDNVTAAQFTDDKGKTGDRNMISHKVNLKILIWIFTLFFILKLHYHFLGSIRDTYRI